VTTISGGISNLIVKVTPSGGLDPVLFKVFGEKTELLVDREQELKTLVRLNALGFGAQVCEKSIPYHMHNDRLLQMSTAFSSAGPRNF
jgi:thiamine kinase-like enzyme